MDRKQIYNMMYEMMKDGDISGAWFLEVIRKHLPNETSDSVIADNLNFNIPATLKNYIPLNYFEKEVTMISLICCSTRSL